MADVDNIEKDELNQQEIESRLDDLPDDAAQHIREVRKGGAGPNFAEPETAQSGGNTAQGGNDG